uniref:Uncharacterized protein n=1 Tax=Tanacetum cinerariifolium TaxID=118510 RepID=A0A6L2MQS7_TANCI|nr:hypothetical protein [Tanacetum cinerariifolium]
MRKREKARKLAERAKTGETRESPRKRGKADENARMWEKACENVRKCAKADENRKKCEDRRKHCGVLSEADHCQPPQYTVNNPIFNIYNDILNSQNKLMEQMTSMCEMIGQFIQKKHEEEQANDARYWKIPACSDDDNDYNFAITPNEPVDSLSMGDEHLDTSLHNEDFLEEIFSNPLFEEEINSMRIGQHHCNAKSDLIESLLNHDSSIIPSSSKIDSLLDEFAGELPLLKSIPPGIDETDYHPENKIRLSQRLLYDNSSPRPPKEFVSENSYAEIEYFSPSPIPIEYSDYPMVEIDLTFTPDDPMPPSIEEDDDDSRDILIREEFLDNYSLPLPENEDGHEKSLIIEANGRRVRAVKLASRYHASLEK